jgi:hypothetical protein
MVNSKYQRGEYTYKSVAIDSDILDRLDRRLSEGAHLIDTATEESITPRHLAWIKSFAGIIDEIDPEGEIDSWSNEHSDSLTKMWHHAQFGGNYSIHDIDSRQLSEKYLQAQEFAAYYAVLLSLTNGHAKIVASKKVFPSYNVDDPSVDVGTTHDRPGRPWRQTLLRRQRPRSDPATCPPSGQMGAVDDTLRSPATGHAFISYVHEDLERATRLRRFLEAADIPVWFDTENLSPGQDWRLEIRRAINSGSLAFLACFSIHTDARATTYQNEELVLAVEQMRRRPPGARWLIPVRFDDCCMPDFDLGAGRTLDSVQRVDLFDEAWEECGDRLLASIQGIFANSASSQLRV